MASLLSYLKQQSFNLKLKGNNMLKKNLIVVFVFGLLLVFVSSLNAQETTTKENKDNKMMMQNGDMQMCMDKIAADSTMRMQMMNKMMNYTKGDKEDMMQMCKTMMDNPGMHKTMMNMMNSEGMMGDGMMNQKSCCMGKKDSDMMKDSTKTMDKSEHKSHH